MKTKLNTDYTGVTLQGFTPDKSVAEVVSGEHIEVHNYSVVSFDQAVTIYFNQDNSVSYIDWPANKRLMITNKINHLTTDTTCNMMFMWKNSELDFTDIDTTDFLVDGSGAYLIDGEGNYLVTT